MDARPNQAQRAKILSETPNEVCDRLQLLIQQKLGGNETNRFDDEPAAILQEILKNKCIIPTQ